MASFSAGTTFTDGVANDVTAAKLAALVNNATPTSGLIQDRTAETVTATNDTLLIGDASDSNNLKRITVANFAQTLPTAKITTGTIQTGTFGTTTSTAATITLVTTGTGTAASPAIVPTGDTNTGIFFPAADTIAFSEGGTESMRIDSSGRVGIGTSSPKGRLQVSNTLISGETGSQCIFPLSVTIGNGGGAYGSIGYNLDYRSATDNTTGVKYLVGDTISQLDFDAGGFIFRNASSGTVGSTATLTERLRIDSSGNVGIGVTNPLVKLHINGITRIGSGNDYQFDSTLKINAESTGATGYLRFYTDSTERLRIDSDGNVGIGTTSPTIISSNSKIIDIVGDASGAVRFERTNSTNPAYGYVGATNGAIELRAQSNTPLLLSTNNTERLRIDSSGRVGIGSTSPARQLTLDHASAPEIGLYTSGTERVKLSTGGTAASQFCVDTGGTERLRIGSSGNVGIGTTGAVNKLEIVGSFGRGAPVTKTGDFTLADTENWIIVNKGSTCTVTLPAASSWTGREFTIKVITAHTVVSASSNVVPRAGGAAVTAILPGTDGAWATLVSNGTNWEIMCSS